MSVGGLVTSKGLLKELQDDHLLSMEDKQERVLDSRYEVTETGKCWLTKKDNWFVVENPVPVTSGGCI